MNAMQYKITLPNDYDMKIIRQRITDNGHKTDHFPGLLFKAYLIIDTPTKKEYAPFYIWNDAKGMNQFIFEGFYDNILASFGWQHIAVAVPLKIERSAMFAQAAYVVEIEHPIQPAEHMTTPDFSLKATDCLGKVLVYNPDKWRYVEFYFFAQAPEDFTDSRTVYELLHLSE
ncbi:DUF4865 family protein [Enterococcus sp. AZ192]|uniref:DUF4865 family protein n=1 Tax=unclassified Enterococcus TaxID=2608891 RepID=UPI003D29CDBC